MNPHPMDRCKALWYLLALALVIFPILTYMAKNCALPTSGIRPASAQSTESASRTDEKYVLTKGQAMAVGRVLMTYQGLRTGKITINIKPVNSDSGYAYRRDIPISAAAKGFWIDHHYYRLVSAGRSKLQIIRIRM